MFTLGERFYLSVVDLVALLLIVFHGSICFRL